MLQDHHLNNTGKLKIICNDKNVRGMSQRIQIDRTDY